jgi:hypothetical protein
MTVLLLHSPIVSDDALRLMRQRSKWDRPATAAFLSAIIDKSVISGMIRIQGRHPRLETMFIPDSK